MVFLNHQFQHFIGDEFCDRVVYSSTRKNHLWCIAQCFCFVCQVVWVNGDAVSSYESWAVFEEVPFGASGFDDIVGVNAYAVADECEFVHEGDVHIALAVLYGFGCLCHFHVWCFVSAVFEDAVVHSIYEVSYLWGRTRGDFFDFGQCVHFVTWIDTLWRVAAEEIHIEFQPAIFLEYRYAIFFGATGING